MGFEPLIYQIDLLGSSVIKCYLSNLCVSTLSHVLLLLLWSFLFVLFCFQLTMENITLVAAEGSVLNKNAH